MSLADDHQINTEQQRAVMQEALRTCDMAVLISTDADGRVRYTSLNSSLIEVIGLSRLFEANLEAIIHGGEADDDA